jgi:hypothetical protein
MILVSDYLMNALLNHTFRNTSFTPPSAVYLALLKEFRSGKPRRSPARFLAAVMPGNRSLSVPRPTSGCLIRRP